VLNLVSDNKNKWHNILISHCNVYQYSLSSLAAGLFGPLDPAVESTTILPNGGDSLPKDKMLNHRRLEHST
jgi:hypothetical protein